LATPSTTRWLSLTDATTYLSCSREFLYRAVKSGAVKHGRVGSSLRFRAADLDDFLLASASSTDVL
jgi:excisionase family DNA binding protein